MVLIVAVVRAHVQVGVARGIVEIEGTTLHAARVRTKGSFACFLGFPCVLHAFDAIGVRTRRGQWNSLRPHPRRALAVAHCLLLTERTGGTDRRCTLWWVRQLGFF